MVLPLPPRRWIPDGIEAVENCGEGVGVLIEHTVDSNQYPRACVPSDLDGPRPFFRSARTGSNLSLRTQSSSAFSWRNFIHRRNSMPPPPHPPPGRAARSCVTLTSGIRASSASLSTLACMPSAISTSPMSSGSSHSTLHVEKTEAAPSISNLSLASLSISTQGS